MIEALEITGLSPDTRVLLGNIITVRAGDLERIKGLNVPDADGKSIPTLEDGHEFPATLSEIGTEIQGEDKVANCTPSTEQPDSRILTNTHEAVVSGNGSEPSPRAREVGPVYSRIDGSWKPVQPTKR